ncbi:MAG: hypothetical protein WC647_10950 [Desulfomonilaceae bacterium]|jgi:hypothetical protein
MNTSFGVFLVTVTVILVCPLFIATDPVKALDKGLDKKSSELSKQEMISARSMAQNGSRKMMDGAKMLQESMNVMKQSKDKATATAMTNIAIQMMAEGEKMVTEAQELAQKNPSIKGQLKPIINSCVKMMGGCQLMREGAGMMLDNEHDRSWAEETVAKGRKRANEAARKIEQGGSRERDR